MITHFLEHKLDPFQQQAMNALNAGKSVLVAAPTGTGKTLIADFLVAKMQQEGRHVAFTAPIKALSNQKFRDYQRLFGPENVGLLTGDLVINQDAPILIMTTEILRNQLLQAHSAYQPHPDDPDSPFLTTASTARCDRIDTLGAVIIDEIHFLGDPYRGTVWEELLIYLPNTIQILGLSATLANLDSFANWLSKIRESKVEVVREEKRTVPLYYFLINSETPRLPPKRFEHAYKKWAAGRPQEPSALKTLKARRAEKSRNPSQAEKERKTNHLDVIRRLDNNAFPALYFIYSRKQTERMAHSLAKSAQKNRFKSLANSKILTSKIKEFTTENPNLLDHFQIMTLKAGIAYHHAGVHVALKAFIEQLYEERLINVLYCTSTFALGVNMPARTVIFDTLTRYDGTEIVPLMPREFMQMAGRAGRRGIDTFGQVIVKMDFEDWKENKPILNHIMAGDLDPISSSFNLSFNSVLHLITQHDEATIRNILSSSFRSYQLQEEALKIHSELQDDDSHLSRRARARRKRQLAEAQRPILWQQFQKKLEFLRTYQYISEDNELYATGKVCIRIQFTEIFLTELYMEGIFEGLPPEKVFGILTGIVQSLPRSANVRPPDDEHWYEIFEKVRTVYHSDVVQYSEELVLEPITLSLELMPLGEMWAQGASLAEILQKIDFFSDMSGDMVGAFRRAKDLMGQLREIMYEDVETRNAFTKVLKKVSRDEVEAVG